MTAYCSKCKKLYYTEYGTSQVSEYKKKKYKGLGQRIEKEQKCPNCKVITPFMIMKKSKKIPMR